MWNWDANAKIVSNWGVVLRIFPNQTACQLWSSSVLVMISRSFLLWKLCKGWFPALVGMPPGKCRSGGMCGAEDTGRCYHHSHHRATDSRQRLEWLSCGDEEEGGRGHWHVFILIFSLYEGSLSFIGYCHSIKILHSYTLLKKFIPLLLLLVTKFDRL